MKKMFFLLLLCLVTSCISIITYNKKYKYIEYVEEMEHNNYLIGEYEKLIAESTNVIEELNKKQEELKELENKINKVSTNIESYKQIIEEYDE